MPSYEEFQNLLRSGEYSTKTSSSKYSGIDPNWVAMAPKRNSPGSESLDNSGLSDSPVAPPANANVPEIQVDSPGITVKYRYDEDSSYEEEAARADRNFMLSNSTKKNIVSDDWLIIVDKPPQAPAARRKRHWQMSDLPRGMDDNEEWRKMLIPTVYWHFGNQRDIWIYDDDDLASDLRKIISAVYPSSFRKKVTVEGPIFCINFQTDDQRQEHAEWILQDLRFLWQHNKGQKLKGLWLNEVFLKTLASHYNQIRGARRVNDFGNPKLLRPIGAVGLCAVSVERAYKLWASKTINTDALHCALPGSLVEPTKDILNEVGSNKTLLSTRFCQTSYGRHQTQYAESAAKIKDARWEVIIKAARRFAKASRKSVNSPVMVFEDDVDGAGSEFYARRANLVELDSD